MIRLSPWAWKAAAAAAICAACFYAGMRTKQAQWDRQTLAQVRLTNSSLVQGMAKGYGLGLRFETSKGTIHDRFKQIEMEVEAGVGSVLPSASDADWYRLLNQAAAGHPLP